MENFVTKEQYDAMVNKPMPPARLVEAWAKYLGALDKLLSSKNLPLLTMSEKLDIATEGEKLIRAAMDSMNKDEIAALGIKIPTFAFDRVKRLQTCIDIK